MSHCWFEEYDVQIFLKYMYALFLEVASRTQKTENVC